VWYHKISIPTHGWFLKILRGWEVSKANLFKGKQADKLEFFRRVGVGFKPKTIRMDIFWKNTLQEEIRC